MFTEGKIRTEFIRQVLERGGQNIHLDMLRSILRLKLIDSTDLVSGITYQADQTQGPHNGNLSFSFPLHGRFQDMGAGSTATGDAISSLGFLGVPATSYKRNARKWYTRNVFGNMNSIVSGLAFGYTEEIKRMIKKELEKSNANV